MNKERKDCSLTFRLPAQEAKQLRVVARSSKGGISALLRQLVKRYLDRKKAA